MNVIEMSPRSAEKSETCQSWGRMEGETFRAYAAFTVYRDIGSDRTTQKAADLLQKSGAVLRRWAARFNWKNRASDFDEWQDQQLQRERVKMRIRFQERALKIANKLEGKIERAIDELQLTERVAGKDGLKVTASPGELARLLELSLEIQEKILGDASEDRVASIQVNFNAYLEEYDNEQPEAVQARQKAELEARQALPD